METAVAWATVGLSGGAGFFFLRWLLEWFGGRMDKRADALDAGTQKLIENLQFQMESMLKRERVLEARVASVETELQDCKRKHSEAEARVLHLEALISERN